MGGTEPESFSPGRIVVAAIGVVTEFANPPVRPVRQRWRGLNVPADRASRIGC